MQADDRAHDILTEAVRRAGEAARRIGAMGFETQIKSDRSPVTSADLEVNRILKETLQREFPNDGWLSEETPDEAHRLGTKRIWVVDPIDGTKYFMRGIPQYTVSVALVEDGLPVLACVFNPATDECFTARRGGGARLNGTGIRMREQPPGRPIVLVSPPSFRRGRFRALETDAEVRPMGSIAYTLALLAAGHADAALNVDRLSEWDIAGGVLLVEEAGGVVTDRRGAPVRFNRPDPSVRGLLAGSPQVHPRLSALAERVPLQ